ncbi:MAG: TonB-dependent receptor [Gemmatimonas sp.]|uniref:TonB-dependent receptor n=1 Tax=Gemmatimonas sp. TaxID=1962908 RepID=UPI0025BE4D08|nr:TonB-dependent receptor [Gemmatimonas sp.]MCA2987096.1 TonB-dependent receptor [Gemmatimonas sp.]
MRNDPRALQFALLSAASLLTISPFTLFAQAAVTRDSAQSLGKVVVTGVTGRGSARAASVVDTAVLKQTAPGTNALKAIERIPGVNMQSVDGFGMYEWSNRITMRGFQSAQIGQTMDGIPLGDMSYGNWNGLGVGRAVDAANLESASVTQGTGALATASANNLGGVVQYATAEPAARQQFMLQQMGGQYAARRSMLRYDLGLRTFGGGSNGVSAFVSVSRFDTDKWKGAGRRLSNFPGEQNLLFGQSGFLGGAGETWHEQVNLKTNLFLGSSKITAFYNYANRKESDFMDLSLGVFNGTAQGSSQFGFGPLFDYFTNWSTARQFAEASIPRYTPLTDAAYYNSAQGARMDHLAYLKGEFKPTATTRLEVQPYLHINRGGGDWHAPSYGAAYSPDPIMFRQTQYNANRMGVMAKGSGTFTMGSVANQFEVGGWYEMNESNNRRPRWRLVNYQQGPEVDFTNVLRLDYDRTADVTTNLLYAQNTSRLLQDRLTLTYGAKYLLVNADFRNNGNTPVNGRTAPIFADQGRPSLNIEMDGGLLPQVGAVFKVNERNELFANWSENVNQFPLNPAGGVYNTAVTTFEFFKSTAKPERATTLEVGARTRRGAIEAGLTAYTIDYRNRLLGVALCPQTVTCASGFGNVGSVNTMGLEGVLNADLGRGLRLFGSATFNRSRFGEDYRTNPSDPNSLVNTRDKFVQDAPQQMLNGSLSYTRRRLNLSLGGRYVGERFFTYTNDLATVGDGAGKVPGYFVSDISARYRVGSIGALKSIELQLNANNVLDERYIATMGSGGFVARGDLPTFLTGAPRQLFLSVNTSF